MKLNVIATAAALALSATTALAGGPLRYLSHKGSWSTFATVTNDTGKPMCGMQVDGRGVSLMAKHTPGSKPFIQIFKARWNIPEGTDIPGYLIFDRSERFPFAGNGGAGPNGEGVVTLGIKPGTEEDFLSLMAEADKMIVGFDQGTQPPLIADMRGSRDAVNTIRYCSGKIDEAAASAPQPFDKPAPQPFGKPVEKPATPAVKKDDGSI